MPSIIEGPWDQAFMTDVPVRLMSKSNARRYTRGSRSGPSFGGFERSLGMIVRASRPSGWECGDPDSPLGDRPSVVCVIAARSVLDAANFSKSVLDALEGVLFHNDASVLGVASIAVRGEQAHRPFHLAVARIEPSAAPSRSAEALSELSRAAALRLEEVQDG